MLARLGRVGRGFLFFWDWTLTKLTGIVEMSKSPVPTTSRRLLSVEAAAVYLGLSKGSVPALISRGTLCPVPLPPVRGERSVRRMKRVLLDIGDLDTFIDHYKQIKPLREKPRARTTGRDGQACRSWHRHDQRYMVKASTNTE